RGAVASTYRLRVTSNGPAFRRLGSVARFALTQATKLPAWATKFWSTSSARTTSLKLSANRKVEGLPASSRDTASRAGERRTVRCFTARQAASELRLIRLE